MGTTGVKTERVGLTPGRLQGRMHPAFWRGGAGRPPAGQPPWPEAEASFPFELEIRAGASLTHQLRGCHASPQNHWINSSELKPLGLGAWGLAIGSICGSLSRLPKGRVGLPIAPSTPSHRLPGSDRLIN